MFGVGAIPPTVSPVGFSHYFVISRKNRKGKTEYLVQTRTTNFETGQEIQPRLYSEEPGKALRFYNNTACATETTDDDEIFKRTVCHG